MHGEDAELQRWVFAWKEGEMVNVYDVACEHAQDTRFDGPGGRWNEPVVRIHRQRTKSARAVAGVRRDAMRGGIARSLSRCVNDLPFILERAAISERNRVTGDVDRYSSLDRESPAVALG